MTKNELLDIVALIQDVYPNAAFDAKKLKTWFAILKDFEAAEIENNFLEYARVGQFPPKPSDLIVKVEEKHIAPGVEETNKYWQQYEGITPASQEVKEKYLAEMRKILGIKRGAGE